jgi:FixJ family two-component response regulator
MPVRAIKAGAVEFLTQPVRDQDLLDGSTSPSRRIASAATTNELLPSERVRFGTLTPRERSAQRSRQTKPPVEELG